MTIYELLKKDHRKVQNLLEQLVSFSKKDDDKWKAIVDEIRDDLIPHLRAEEAVFYNAIREKGGDTSLIAHEYTEHATAESELRTLQAMKSVDMNWTALATKLKTDIIHHAKEEESKVFAAAKKIFSDEEAKKIGDAFTALKPLIKEQSLMGTTVDLIANLLPESISAGFVKNMSAKKEQKAS